MNDVDFAVEIYLSFVGLLLIVIIVYFIFRAILLIKERREQDIEEVEEIEINRKVSKIKMFEFLHK